MKIPNFVRNTKFAMKPFAFALAAGAALVAGNSQAVTVATTYQLGLAGKGTTIEDHALIPWVTKGSLLSGAFLKSVAVKATLDAKVTGDTRASDLCVYLNSTPDGAASGPLQIGGRDVIGTVDDHLSWVASANNTVGAMLIDKKTAPKDFPDGIDLSSVTLMLGSGGGKATWSGTVTIEYVAPPATFLTFGLPGNPAVITGTDVAWTVPFGTDVTTLAPTYTLSSGSCVPDSGSTQDFTSPQPYTVTDGAVSNLYTVTVTVAPVSSAKNMLTFGPGAVINGAHITWTVPKGTDVTSLAPTYTVSRSATGAPASGTAQDFTKPVTYTVTAQDGSAQDYTVTVIANGAAGASAGFNSGAAQNGTTPVFTNNPPVSP